MQQALMMQQPSFVAPIRPPPPPAQPLHHPQAGQQQQQRQRPRRRRGAATTVAAAASSSSSSSAVAPSGGGGGSSGSGRQQVRAAGPPTPAPAYAAIDAEPLNAVVMALFRRKMVAALGGADSPLQGYAAIIDLTRRLNAAHPTARGVQQATRGILRSLFPPWLPGAFAAMFSRPLPGLSCRLNAFATAATCRWLMGPCAVNDVELDDGSVGVGHGVLVERCRYLEEAGCASVCLNSCKLPTQEFFARDMGLALTMTPNYDDFSCQFAFGKTPPPREADDAFETPCFSQCPSRARRFTDGGDAASGCCPNIGQQ